MHWTSSLALAALSLLPLDAADASELAWTSGERSGALRVDEGALHFPDGTRLVGLDALELDARHHASAALRDLVRVERDRAIDGRRPVALDDATLTVGGSSDFAPSWTRALESGNRLWWPCDADSALAGTTVAYGAAYDADLERLAAWLVGRELLAEHQSELAARLDALAPSGGGWIAAPGEYWAADADAIRATLTGVQGAIFASAHVRAAAELVTAGDELHAPALGTRRLAEALWQTGAPVTAVVEAVRALTPESFNAAHRALYDPAALRIVHLAAGAPDDAASDAPAFDLSRTAWLQGDDAGRKAALALLERLGGAQIWAAARVLRLDATSRTSTQLGDTVADSVTTRVLDGVLTHVAQQVEVQGSVQSLSLAFLGSHVLVRQGDTIVERSGAIGARLMVTERRALVRLLADLARRGPVGARSVDATTLELFDAHAPLGTLELTDDGDVAAFSYPDMGSARRFEYEAPVAFGELRYPGRYREVGARAVEVTITRLETREAYDPALFRDPRR